MPTTTKRSLNKDTKPIKNDLEKIVNVGETLIKSPPSFWSKLKYGLMLAGSVFVTYDDYQHLRKEVEQDATVTNKPAYYADVVRESANYLAKYIIDKYI